MQPHSLELVKILHFLIAGLKAYCLVFARAPISWMLAVRWGSQVFELFSNLCYLVLSTPDMLFVPSCIYEFICSRWQPYQFVHTFVQALLFIIALQSIMRRVILDGVQKLLLNSTRHYTQHKASSWYPDTALQALRPLAFCFILHIIEWGCLSCKLSTLYRSVLQESGAAEKTLGVSMTMARIGSYW